MSDNKITMLSEKFENEKTGEQVEGVTIMIDGKLKNMLDKKIIAPRKMK